MYATNSALVWKRMADKNQQSAKLMARISIVLAVLLLMAGGYAFSAQAQYRELCTTIKTQSESINAGSVREFGKSLTSAFCG